MVATMNPDPQALPPLPSFDEAWRRAEKLDVSGDLQGAAAAWDALLLWIASAAITPNEVALSICRAFNRRICIPIPVDLNVASAVQVVVDTHIGELSDAEQSEFYLLLAVALFPRGVGTLADLLRTAQLAVDLGPPTAPATEHALGRARLLGFLADALLRIGAHEEASVHLTAAELLLSIAPIGGAATAVLAESVDRLAAGSSDPMIELGVSAATGDLVMFVRQLQSDAASQRGDLALSIALDQSLAALGGARAAAFVLNAASTLTDSGEFTSACRILDRLGDSSSWADAGPQLAIVAGLARLGAGDLVTATNLHAHAAELLAARPDAEVAAYFAQLSAWLHRATGDATAAATSYEESVYAALASRRAPLGYRYDTYAMRAVAPFANEAMRYLVEEGRIEAVLRMTEAVKSARLATILAHPATATPAPGVADAGRALRQGLRNEAEAIAIQLDGIARALGTADNAAVGPLLEQREALRERRRDVLSQAELVDPIWVSLTELMPFDVSALREHLGSTGTAAITLFRLDSDVVSIVVDGAGYDMACTSLDEATLRRVTRYASNLVDQHPNNVWFDPLTHGLTLDQFIPSNLVERCAKAQAVVIAPHRDLHLLPWPMMPWRGGRLVEHVGVAIVPNLACLAPLSRHDSRPWKLGIFGPPSLDGGADPGLSSATAEVDEIVALVGSDRVIERIAGEKATESQLAALLQATDLTAIHLSCHGVTVPDDPLSSGLKASDGVLECASLTGATIAASEVFASACSIGWRPTAVRALQLIGDDVLGMPATFLLAGATAFVVSTTKVGDPESGAFAVSYYRERMRGVTSFEAFHAAQLNALTGGLAVHLWCGFSYYGFPHRS
jgi:CHAT domain-containing protein